MSKEQVISLIESHSSDELSAKILGTPPEALSEFLIDLSDSLTEVVLKRITPAALAHVLRRVPLSVIELMAVKVGFKVFAVLYSRMDSADCTDIYSRLSGELKIYVRNEFDFTTQGRLLKTILHRRKVNNDYSMRNAGDASTVSTSVEGRHNELEELDALRKQLELLKLENQSFEVYSKKRDEEFEVLEAAYTAREYDLLGKIDALEQERQKQLQDKIEHKVPEFVGVAIKALSDKETLFSDKALNWNILGGIAVGLAILTAVASFWVGLDEFRPVADQGTDWLVFIFFLLKGLIVISLCAAWAKHAYSVAGAYMHESLKRSDRMHAINFGKLYLEIYGNSVNQVDMKAVFENWNLDSDSAFVRLKAPVLEPKVMEQMATLVEALAKITDAEKKRKEP